jgi:predicted Fe-Mo cluster-binding NifX family protein
MKIAISTRGRELESSIDLHFEDAKFFIIFDLDNSMGYEILINSMAHQFNTSGILLAQQLINLGINTIITGKCDPNTYRVLQAAEVKVNYRNTGTVKEILADFKKYSTPKQIQTNKKNKRPLNI